MVGGVNQSRLAAVSQTDALRGESREETGRKGRAFSPVRDQVLGGPGRIRNQIRLRSVVLTNGAKEFVAQSQIQGELRGNLPVVLEIRAVVVADIIGAGEIRGKNIIRAPDVIETIGNGGRGRGEKKLRDPGISPTVVPESGAFREPEGYRDAGMTMVASDFCGFGIT